MAKHVLITGAAGTFLLTGAVARRSQEGQARARAPRPEGEKKEGPLPPPPVAARRRCPLFAPRVTRARGFSAGPLSPLLLPPSLPSGLPPSPHAPAARHHSKLTTPQTSKQTTKQTRNAKRRTTTKRHTTNETTKKRNTGQIGYALCPMVAAGRMLGPDQPVVLHLLDIPPAAKALEGVRMELLDAAFPLLEGEGEKHANEKKNKRPPLSRKNRRSPKNRSQPPPPKKPTKTTNPTTQQKKASSSPPTRRRPARASTSPSWSADSRARRGWSART